MSERNEQNDWNQSIIEEFRANGGKVGGRFAGATLLLLTTTGAKTGKTRINPLGCLAEGERLYVFASKAGGPTNPDWYYNLLAHPEVRVEVGTESFPARARVITGEERDRIYARQAERVPVFAQYQQQTRRTIPVVDLTRIR